MISKSQSKTDIPIRIMKEFCALLAKPLTVLINRTISEGCWPDFLKIERVTPVNKVSHPQNINELRNISGLLVIDKIMESIISKRIIEDMKEKLDPQQFANQPGMNIQHYLISMIDRVLLALEDNSPGEAFAVLATFVDWKEAFSRQDPTLGVQSFINNGVRPSLIPVISSYFENRKMYVQWRGHESILRDMPGGGPQGGTFGIWSYLSQSKG